MGKELIKILKEMCHRVGADFDSIDFLKDRWFMEYEWTEKEQDKFQEWLINHLYTNTKAFKEIAASPNSKSKKNCENISKMFLLNYGWKFKQIKHETQTNNKPPDNAG